MGKGVRHRFYTPLLNPAVVLISTGPRSGGISTIRANLWANIKKLVTSVIVWLSLVCIPLTKGNGDLSQFVYDIKYLSNL